jgi:hypothetical protein
MTGVPAGGGAKVKACVINYYGDKGCSGWFQD